MKAVLSEAKIEGGWPSATEEEIRKNKESLNNNAESHLFLLSLPIVVQTESVKQIVTVAVGNKWIRVYPPFPVNEGAETRAAFKDVEIPEGVHRVEKSSTVPDSAVTGVRAEATITGATWCRGLRLDVETGAQSQRFLNHLLEQLAQYTQQWWLRAIHNPFLGPRRFGAQINTSYDLAREFRYHGAGEIESAWYGVVERQHELSIGYPLTEELWGVCCDLAAKSQSADAGILSFLDGIAAFMAGRQDQSILHLCIAVEVVANKHRIIIQNKRNLNLDKLVRETPLLDEAGREFVKCLVIDRGHVAHGRKPHCLGRRPGVTIQSYILVVQNLINAYLQSLRYNGKWPEAMTIRL